MDPTWARTWFATTALAAAVGIGIALVQSVEHPTVTLIGGEIIPKFGENGLERALNNFAFFTTLSNLIVAVTCLLLAVNPVRRSATFAVFRLTGLVAITVTFVVFHVALRNLLEMDTWAYASDRLVHFVVPIMTVIGWIAFGPRGCTSARVARLTVLYPAAYMLFTVIRGPLVADWYPYPFAECPSSAMRG